MCLVHLGTLIYLSSVFTVIHQVTLMIAGLAVKFAVWDALLHTRKASGCYPLIKYLVICRHPDRARSKRAATNAIISYDA